jgi:hypothetical protein
MILQGRAGLRREIRSTRRILRTLMSRRGLKNPDEEKGGEADLRLLLILAVEEVCKNLDNEKGGINRPSEF